jgi:peptidoglycan/xylan/chitin deacetylase (PgdA/CDA1 family)
MRPPVLCYHAVSATWPHQLAVTPEALESQLSLLLRRGYRPVDAAEAVTGEGKLLHVTFDDAFTSVLNALPVLERLGVPATVFVCTGYADDPRPLGIPELADDLHAHAEELRTMSWDDLRDLAERDIAVESHTVSHQHLPALTDEQLAGGPAGSWPIRSAIATTASARPPAAPATRPPSGSPATRADAIRSTSSASASGAVTARARSPSRRGRPCARPSRCGSADRSASPTREPRADPRSRPRGCGRDRMSASSRSQP